MRIELEDVPTGFRSAVLATLADLGIEDGHLAVELVDENRIRELNLEHRDLDRPTDVLSFPIDQGDDGPGPRELGDVVICEAQCEDVTEAAVHGVLHLCGFDHETDDGEMLKVQDRIMAGLTDTGESSLTAEEHSRG
ncbi:MAG: rRNA maturation RNase YbeY [Solirubrobacterales bacterium]